MAFTKAKTEVAFGTHMVPKKKSKSRERTQSTLDQILKTVMPSKKAAVRAAYEKKNGQTDKSVGRKTSQVRRPVTATLKTTKRKTIDDKRVISPIETLLLSPKASTGMGSVGSRKYTMSKKIQTQALRLLRNGQTKMCKDLVEKSLKENGYEEPALLLLCAQSNFELGYALRAEQMYLKCMLEP